MKELIAIQKELNVPKNQRNKFGNYNYRSCEDILVALKPLLDKHKSSILIKAQPTQKRTAQGTRSDPVLLTWSPENVCMVPWGPCKHFFVRRLGTIGKYNRLISLLYFPMVPSAYCTFLWSLAVGRNFRY